MNTTALLHLIIVLTIGIFTGLALRSYRLRSVEPTIRLGAGAATYALIGIAGSFTGFQVALVLGLPSFLIPYLAALAGALMTLVLWRGP